MFAARLVIAPYPALTVGYQLMRSNVPLIDSGKGARSLRYYVHKRKVFMGSKIYTGLMFLSLFEPPLLSFLPWFASEFAKASFFPTLGTLRLTFLVKLLQLLVTFVAQILVICYQYTNFSGTNNDSFVALIYLNVCLSSLTFVLKIIEGSVKRGVLAGSALSEERNGICRATAAIRREMEKGKDDINREDRGLDNKQCARRS